MKASMGFGMIFLTFLLLGSHFRWVCFARDTITVQDLLADKEGETLISAGTGTKFELGFFSTPEGRIDGGGGRYVGIWYSGNHSSPRTVVWVANRDKPILGSASTGVLAIAEDGNLKVLDGDGKVYFSTDLESSSSVYRTVKLMGSGNLVLIDGQSGDYLWQSFKNPTDTFLPGMFMDENLKLISWASREDPRSGNYTFQIDPEDNNQFLIMKRTVWYWKSDQSGGSIRSIEMPEFVAAFLSNFSTSMNDQNKSPMQYSNLFYNFSIPQDLFANARLLMRSSGEIEFSIRDNRNGLWGLFWSEPREPCSVYNPCGNFGICSNRNRSFTCECLPGFQPDSPDNWNYGDFSSGCARKSPVCNMNMKPDAFLNLKLMKVGSKFSTYSGGDVEEKCKEECLSNCQCQAYFYVGLNGRSGTRNAGASCLIWTTELSNLQKDYQYTDGIKNFSISIRVAASDIESTTRDCESCGQNILPYPLSDGSSCGDPAYQSFHCDKSTGKLRFLTLNGSYEVASINKDVNTFVIRANGAGNVDDCSAKESESRGLMLNQSLPFDVANWCYDDDSFKGERKIQIRWGLPLEPLCNSWDECTPDWPNSVCSVTTDGTRRCLCNQNYRWDGRALNCTHEVGELSTQGEKKRNATKLIVSITVVFVVLLAGSSFFFFRRRVLLKRKERKEIILGNTAVYLNDNEIRQAQDLVVEDNKAIDVPFFTLESILTATDNFSNENKLGQGGFGPVYKGLFNDGKELAVKRLLSHSGQGFDEFQNEVVLIAKLQHRNLVRLLGYCIKGSEKLLLYEYMPNKSLDTFIFDQERSVLLDWKKRFEIILGVTRGLLYLHQDSRLRIIHRDLKTSNILLDEELNPKISDFGLARIVGGKETGANTNKIVGTYGYMSPEYALEGLFSVKSDVFSFGVILLEIISGKRNIGFYEQVLSLLGYAWKLWQERNPLEFIDKELLKSCNNSRSDEEVSKCINIGLLCVQEDPFDRPTMADVLIMLVTETTTLPCPNQPAFVSRKRADSSVSGSSSSKQDIINSINELTVSAVEGR